MPSLPHTILRSGMVSKLSPMAAASPLTGEGVEQHQCHNLGDL
ncbi:hypothetical protein HMPREF9577_00449 [Cutibacterium acnes HL110PA3]|nr:hypothetical protein HMPREF9577_00449 [Cutibacterium acnes HL110PA3]MCW5113651.1 hypothetical protein [Cutibacterium acnes P05]